MGLRNAVRAAVVTGAAAVALAAPAQAQAGEVGTQDWNGNCSTSTYSTSAWGWCDGTGPQRYRIFVQCTNGGSNTYIYGSQRTPWFGDRNGATAYCPSGMRAISSWGGRA